MASRPHSEQQHYHDDIEAAGSIAIPIPPPSRGLPQQQDGDPFHRRHSTLNKASSSAAPQYHGDPLAEKSHTSSNVTDPEVSSTTAEIPRGLPVASGSSSSRNGGANNNPSKATNKAVPDPKLIHPLLNKIPLHIRFGLNGLLTNVLVRLK